MLSLSHTLSISLRLSLAQPTFLYILAYISLFLGPFSVLCITDIVLPTAVLIAQHSIEC
jgi:hypothetical protein